MCIICNLNVLDLSTPLPLSTSEAVNTAAPSPGAGGVGDSFYPGFGNGGYDVAHYTLDLNVTDVDTSTLDATTTIEAEATQDLSSFNLDFIGFEIEGITVNGQAATYTREGQELIITPVEAIAEGEAFTVEVDYNGSPEPINSVAFTFPVPTGWVTFDGGNFVLSEPDGAANYYPVNDHPLDRASYTFRVTVPEPFEVAANGVLEQSIDNGDTTTYVFEARDPMVSYLTTVNIYDGFNLEFDGEVDGVPIRNYFAEGIPEELLAPFDLQPEMLDFFNDIFGPYPFEVYGSVVVNTDTGAALETQTLSIFGTGQLGNGQATKEVIAHELAHQWFGDSIALADWSDIWLNESFATYSQGLWVEYSQGSEALDQWVTEQYNYIAERFDNVTPPGEPTPDTLFNAGVYEWGALGLHALRLEVGDDAFFDTLQTYVERFTGENVTPEDFLGVAEEVSGQELDAFFDEWFYNEELASIPELGLFAGTLGDDTLFGTTAGETLTGLDGNDILYGNGGIDTFFGNSGDDLIYGGAQADGILAGSGNDTIYANGGEDFIDSGLGFDTVWLGGGDATVLLRTSINPAVSDDYVTINNFQLGATQLQVRGGIPATELSFVDSAEGAQILLEDDLLAIVSWQTASTFSNNLSEIFV